MVGPSLSSRMWEGLLVALVVVVLRSLQFGSTAELATILVAISLGVLICLGIAELIAWKRWSIR